MDDELKKRRDKVFSFIQRMSPEPVETMEIVRHFEKTLTRQKVMTVLIQLIQSGNVNFKKVGSGQGVWIWYIPKKKKPQSID